MASTLTARLEKLESAMPSEWPAFHIPLVTTDKEVAAARKAAIAQAINPEGDDIWCIRLVGVEPQRRQEAASW